MLWAAVIKANGAKGLPQEAFGPAGRILVNEFSQTKFDENIYVVGDQSLMLTNDNSKGDPQVAQVAIQQAQNVAKNLNKQIANQPLKPIRYNDKGSMATIGRNLAVADLNFANLKGFLAWMIWLFVHLMAIFGTKTKSSFS